MFDRIDGDARLVGGEALAELGERRARVFGAYRRKPQRVAALGEAVHDVAKCRLVLAEQERDFRIDFVGRRERVRVLRDSLRQHGELVRVIDFAQAAAALADLLRRLLGELQQPAVALVDRVETARERRQALFVIGEALRRGVDSFPPALDGRRAFPALPDPASDRASSP